MRWFEAGLDFIYVIKTVIPGGPNDCSSQVTALGRLSSQANNSMGCVRIFARAVSNQGPPDYSYDDINFMPFTTLLSALIRAVPQCIKTRKTPRGPGEGCQNERCSVIRQPPPPHTRSPNNTRASDRSSGRSRKLSPNEPARAPRSR